MAKPLTSWLVPSFLQHNLRLVVSGCCLHISVTKFQDKFTSLRQVIKYPQWLRKVSNMLYRHVFDKISTEFRSTYFACFCEFRGSATARNIRSPDYELHHLQTGD